MTAVDSSVVSLREAFDRWFMSDMTLSTAVERAFGHLSNVDRQAILVMAAAWAAQARASALRGAIDGMEEAVLQMMDGAAPEEAALDE